MSSPLKWFITAFTYASHTATRLYRGKITHRFHDCHVKIKNPSFTRSIRTDIAQVVSRFHNRYFSVIYKRYRLSSYRNNVGRSIDSAKPVNALARVLRYANPIRVTWHRINTALRTAIDYCIVTKRMSRAKRIFFHTISCFVSPLRNKLCSVVWA